MVPVCPGPRMSGLKVLVPNVMSDHKSPASEVTAESKSFRWRTAAVATGAAGAPPGPVGPISDGNITQRLQGTSGLATDASMMPLPIGCDWTSGVPVPPTKKPTSFETSIVIGTVDCARKSARFTWVGRYVPKQAPGSCVTDGQNPIGLRKVPNCSDVKLCSRPSAKYACARPPVLVIVTGTTTGAAPAESLVPELFGSPFADTRAVSRPICAVNGNVVWLPDVK